MTRDDDRSIDNGPPIRASFTIRCSVGNGRKVRARLLDVCTGRYYPITDLNLLPEILERLLKPLVYESGGEETRGVV